MTSTSTGAAEPIDLTTFTYSPARIRNILARWEAYVAAAESPSTSRNQSGPEHPGPTPNTPRLTPKHSYRADTMGGACIVADIERAAACALSGLSLEWYTVQGRMLGYRLEDFVRRMPHIPRDDIHAAYKSACDRMARYLGWVEETERP